MKLVLVTAVEEFRKDVIKLFKKAKIECFSESEIDGYKLPNAVMVSSNWFGTERSVNESVMFFSFTDESHIETLFELIMGFNKTLETNNPIHAVIVPIEKSI